MEASLLSQGLELMLAGMGTVFVFLTLLVFATRFMSWAVARYMPEELPTTGPVAAVASRPTPEEIAAISAAIALHNKVASNSANKKT